jgi:16S rRNA (guanine966-N2)-methyltransferase
MRIIAGKFKNRTLIAPKGMETRPTSGMLREAVFNMLQQSIEGAVFLDLFAGSGAIGFEALSRGATRVVFVDISRASTQSIERNIEALGVGSQSAIVKGDVFATLDKLQKKGELFDVIYVDPPYTLGKNPTDSPSLKVLSAIDKGNLLKEDGTLFIEESKEVSLEIMSLSNIKFVKKRNFGRSCLFHFVDARSLK